MTDPEKEKEVLPINKSGGLLLATLIGVLAPALYWRINLNQITKTDQIFSLIIIIVSGFILFYKALGDFNNSLTADGKMGDANRSLIIIAELFLLILAVIVFGTILVLK